jgi:hypothetical protein
LAGTERTKDVTEVFKVPSYIKSQYDKEPSKKEKRMKGKQAKKN